MAKKVSFTTKDGRRVSFTPGVRKRTKRKATAKQSRALAKGRATLKRKAFKGKKRSIMHMARRKTKSRRRSSSRGLGGMLGMLSRAGNAFAVGFGTSTVLNTVADSVGMPQLKQIAPIAGAFTAYQTGKGIPGIVAAYPLLTAGGINILGNLLPGQAQGPTAGVGAFV